MFLLGRIRCVRKAGAGGSANFFQSASFAGKMQGSVLFSGGEGGFL
tara:strand:- start:605 stop:742 length:138 start_codon:yes stop_codon:yes gene_type:complete